MGIAQFDSQRKTYFDGIGTKLEGTQKTAEALALSGLDYTVVKKDLFLADGTKVENKFATVKEDTNSILGIVGKNYNIVQNVEGFAFIDDIIGNGGADFECAGTIDKGRGAFMLAKTDPIHIMGDDFDPYILFSNYHDGTGCVKAMFTPIRTWCSNCLALASKRSSFSLSVRHCSTVKDKIYAANAIMKSHTAYISEVEKDANTLSTVRFTKDQFEDAIYKLIKVEADASNSVLERAEDARVQLMRAYEQDDLNNYGDTAWKALQAVSDYASHYAPKRNTNNPYIFMQRVQNGEIAAMLGLMISIIVAKNPGLQLNLNY